jgi:hypothetical protein
LVIGIPAGVARTPFYHGTSWKPSGLLHLLLAGAVTVADVQAAADKAFAE